MKTFKKSAILGLIFCIPTLYAVLYFLFLGSTASAAKEFTLKPIGFQNKTVQLHTHKSPVLQKSVSYFKPAMRAHSLVSGEKIGVANLRLS